MKITILLAAVLTLSRLTSLSQLHEGAMNTAAAEDVSRGASALGTLVRENAASVFKVSGARAPVFLADIPVDISLPGKGIYISRPRLKKILAGNTAAYSGLIIQFLVAHELAHQLQFSHYKENMSNIVSCEARRLYECQADILAGVYVSGLYDLPDSVVINARLTPIMLHTLEYVYSIGDEENSRVFHPSFTERRTAFRLGLAYPVVRSNFEKAKNTFAGEAIDHRKGEDSLAWSLRLARYILHYPNSVNKHIVFTPIWAKSDTASIVRWDTSRSNPVVQYEIGSFKNINSFAVNLFLQCKLTGKYWDSSLQDPKNAVLQGRSKNYNVRLGPGDSVFVQGDLNWYGLSTSVFMPRFDSPPGQETLFCAEPVDAKDVELDANCPSYDFGSQTAGRLRERLSIDLLLAIGASATNFRDLEVGFGQSTTQNDIDYAANLGYNSGIGVTHHLAENSAELTIPLYDGDDSSQAKERFGDGAGSLLQLAAGGDLKIEDDYWKFYDDGPDSSNTFEIKRGTIHHIINDTILVTIDKYGEKRKIEGNYKPSGTRVLLEYRFEPFSKGDRYKVDITVYSPNS